MNNKGTVYKHLKYMYLSQFMQVVQTIKPYIFNVQIHMFLRYITVFSFQKYTMHYINSIIYVVQFKEKQFD